MLTKYIYILLTGMLAGFSSGALGITSAPVLIPLLVLFNLVNTYKASIGTTLFAVLPPLSIFAVITYYKNKQVDIKLGLMLMIIIASFAYLGSLFTQDASPQTVALISGGLLFSLSMFWFYCGVTGKFIT